jgi:glutathione S-transferase
VAATVYAIPGSHPVRTALLMLDLKGIPYRRVDLPTMLCRPFLRARGFSGPTVPAIRLEDGTRLQRTTEISRALDLLVPDPPLFPADPERRRAVEEAERWGDEVLQDVPRRLSYAVLNRDRSALASFLERPLLGVPPRVVAATAAPVLWLGARVNGADEDATRRDLAVVPDLVAHVDGLLEQGVIGGEAPNAADLQIAPSIRLLMLFDDLAPVLEGTAAADHAMRIVPAYAGRFPAVL